MLYLYLEYTAQCVYACVKHAPCYANAGVKKEQVSLQRLWNPGGDTQNVFLFWIYQDKNSANSHIRQPLVYALVSIVGTIKFLYNAIPIALE